MFNTNVKNAETTPQQFGLVPEGQYDITIDAADLKVANTEAKTEFVQLQMNIDSGEQKGRKVFDQVFTTAKAAPRMRLLLESTGFDPDNIDEFDEQSLIGCKCRIYVEHRAQQGYTTNARPAFGGYGLVGIEL